MSEGMKLSRRQEIVLRFLNACHWADHEWTAIHAALVMHGEKSCNGRVTADSLVNRKLVVKAGRKYMITIQGIAVANEVKRA